MFDTRADVQKTLFVLVCSEVRQILEHLKIKIKWLVSAAAAAAAGQPYKFV